jgi:GTPase SAR1 family protein
MNKFTDIPIKDEDQVKVIVAGTTGSGKTTLVERIIYDNKDKFKNIICFCPSKRLGTNDYECLGAFVDQDVSMENIMGKIKAQEQLARLYKAKKLREPPHCLIILDDILDSTLKLNGKDRPYFVGMLSTCRKAYISLIIVVQTLHNTIPTGIRDQTDILYFYRCGFDGKIVKQMLPPIRPPEGYKGKVMSATQFEEYIGDTAREKNVCVMYNAKTGTYNQKFKVLPAPKFVIERYIEEDVDCE